MADAPFSCTCGKIKGDVKVVPAAGLHLHCYCASCRAGVTYCGADLPAGTPVDLYLTPPQHVRITQGQENLAPFVFGPKGIVRFQAACCGGQMFSSPANPKIGFMSLCASTFDHPEVLGPVLTESFVPKSGGKTGHKGMMPLFKLILAAVVTRITGSWRKTPLFDVNTLKPIAPVTVLSPEERKALLKT